MSLAKAWFHQNRFDEIFLILLGAGAAYFCDWILGDVSQISCSDSKSFQRLKSGAI